MEAFVADLRGLAPARRYDVIVIDRTLHMVDERDRTEALDKLLHFTSKEAAVLIADERQGISAFVKFFAASEHSWTPILKKRGFLFVRCSS